MATEKKPIDRQTMASRLAMEFQDGWVVNLGIGIPTLCSNYKNVDREIIFQSENGVIGYGALSPEGEEDPTWSTLAASTSPSIPGQPSCTTLTLSP